MDVFLLLMLYLFIFIGLPLGVGFLLYFVPKRLGYPKTAKYLTLSYGLLAGLLVLIVVFEDQFFSKDKAKELVQGQQIVLMDKFEIRENKSFSAIGDYYHTFTLKISQRDNRNAVLKIKSASNYKALNANVDKTLYLSGQRYFGTKITQNYETQTAYVREYFQPSGRQGYAPTFRRISINKATMQLKFEDIDE